MVANEVVKTPRSNITDGMDQSSGIRLNPQRHKLKHRFDIMRKLGQGTYGKVQLGINKETGQEVAIKTIKKAKIETEQDLIRIRREIQIMSSVRHPNIIHIYEVFENRERIVLVMEFAAGGELYDYLSERKVLNEIEARRIFRQIAASIYYCHKHKICHRDLKLENILLDEFGNAKIADFGLSNVFDGKRCLNTFCGSPLYASPEIVKGTPYFGPEVDCWSLGVLLYTLVYGAMPFDGSNFKRLVKQISSGDYFEPKKASPASDLIRHMLTVHPTKRANIEDICSHWWVNEGYGESCLEIAEELANQTPVRLDLLLQLAPPPNKEDLVIGKDAEQSMKEETKEGSPTPPVKDNGASGSKNEDIEFIDLTAGDAPTKNTKRKMVDSPLDGIEPLSKEKCKDPKVEDFEMYKGVDETPAPTECEVIDVSMASSKSKMEVSDVKESGGKSAETRGESPREALVDRDKPSEVTCDDQIQPSPPPGKGTREPGETLPLTHPTSSSTMTDKIEGDTVIKEAEKVSKAKKTKSVKSKTCSSIPKDDSSRDPSPSGGRDSKEKSPVKVKKERRNSNVSQVAQRFNNSTSGSPGVAAKSNDKPRKLLLTALRVNDAKRAFESKVADKKAVVIPGLKVSDARKAFEDKNSEPKDTGSGSPSRRGSKCSDPPLLKTDITGRKVSLDTMSTIRRDSTSSTTPTEEIPKVESDKCDKSANCPVAPLPIASGDKPAASESGDKVEASTPTSSKGKKREHLNSLNKDLDEMVTVLQAVDDIIKGDTSISEPMEDAKDEELENKNIEKIMHELRNKIPRPVSDQSKTLQPTVSCSSGSVSDTHTLTPDQSVPSSPVVDDKLRKSVLIECSPNVTKVASMAGCSSQKQKPSSTEKASLSSSQSKTLPRGFRHMKSVTPEPGGKSEFAGTENSFLRKIAENGGAPGAEKDNHTRLVKRLSSCLEEDKTCRPTIVRGSSLEPKKSEVEFFVSNLKPPTPTVTAKVTSIKAPTRDSDKKITQRTEVSFPVNIGKSPGHSSSTAAPERVSHSVEKVIPINYDKSSDGRYSAPVSPPTSHGQGSLPSRVPVLDKSTDRRSQGKEFIIPIALEGGGYAAPSSTTSSTPSTPKSEQPDWVKNLEARLRDRGPNMRFTRAKRLGNIFSENGSEDESAGSSVSSPFGSLQRYSSFGKRGPLWGTKERESGSRMYNRYKSRVEHSDSFSSAGEEDEDDDDGFEILTAESLFSTLLARVRSLTRRLNQDTPTSSLRRAKYSSQDNFSSSSFRRQDSDAYNSDRQSVGGSFDDDDTSLGSRKAPSVSFTLRGNSNGETEPMKTEVPATCNISFSGEGAPAPHVSVTLHARSPAFQMNPLH